ncbi:penicillin acylase family protein [bacterium]|nr:penicillin acylase family protein [bacterium]
MLRAFLVLVVIAVLLSGGGYFVAQRSLPVLDGIVSFPELGRGAAVKFDERAVPYIEAASELDLYRIQGYVTAQDRLFQMDMMRRTAAGELSEVFGSQSLSHDKLVRTIGINRAAAAELKGLSKDVTAALDAYTQGVNAYINTSKDRLAIEFLLLGYKPKAWTSQDSLEILKYNQYCLDESWRLDDLRQRVIDKAGNKIASRLFDRIFEAPPAVSSLPGRHSVNGLIGINGTNCMTSIGGTSRPSLASALSPAPGWGSNGWVVSSGMTESKGAYLALDRHFAFTQPCDWYLVSLKCPSLHLAGAAMPGVPGVVNGRNDRIAFGLTSLKVDVQDLFLEQFSPQFPNKYKTPTGWANAKEIVEEIPVRFSSSLVLTSNLLHKVLETRHGPILIKNDENAVALSWVGLNQPEKTISCAEAIYRLNHSANWAQFQSGLEHYAGSPFTFLFADKDGHIGYQQAGSIPERSTAGKSNKFESCLLNPGWVGTGDWVANLPFKDMEHAFDPAEGYYVANFRQSRTEMPLNLNVYRAQRILNVLATYKKNAQKPGLPEMALLQGDQLAPLAPLVKRTLAEAIGKTDSIDAFQLSALDSIGKWDGVLTENSSGAALYESFIRTVVRRILEPRLGTNLANEYLERYPGWSQVVERILLEKNSEWLPSEERTFKGFVITSFGQAVKDVRLQSKSDEPSSWKWGDMHKIVFESELLRGAPDLAPLLGVLNGQSVAVGGDQDTVSSMESSLRRGPEQFVCRSGPTMRILIDLSDSEKFYQTLTLGQSSNLLSNAHADQLRSWLTLKPLPIAFSPALEEKISEHRLLFTDR